MVENKPADPIDEDDDKNMMYRKTRTQQRFANHTEGHGVVAAAAAALTTTS